MYGAKTTPHMFVIDAAGVLRYRGAIDDDPNGKQSRPKNYVDSGGPRRCSASSTPKPGRDRSPCGCSVKYKSASN